MKLFRSMLLACAALGATAAGAQTIPSDPQANCTVSSTDFAGWFKSGTPSVNGFVTPANSVTFPSNVNCDFFIWSERMFLWLTSPASSQYGGSANVFDSGIFYQVVPGPGGTLRFVQNPTSGPMNFALRAEKPGPDGLPIIFDNHNVRHNILPTKLSANGKPLIQGPGGKTIEVQPKLGAKGQLMLLDAKGKQVKPAASAKLMATPAKGAPGPSVMRITASGKAFFITADGTPIIPDQGQAGGGGVLLSQNGANPDSLVYYATFVNDVFAYYLTQVKTANGGSTPAGTVFPTTADQLASIVKYAAQRGVVFPDPEALAIEIKTSWVDASTIPNPQDYVQIDAIVPTYNTTSSTTWTPNGSRPAKLALVGIHVVGSAHNHPEMIWSTFEHTGNAPNAAYSYINVNNQLINVPQDTSGSWLFCQAGCQGTFNNELAEVDPAGTGNIIAPSGVPAIAPSNTIRWHAWGAAADTSPNSDATAPVSNSLMISINNSIMSQIPAGDIRAKYIFTGSTWTNSGVEPNNPFYGNPNPSPVPTFPPGNEIGTSQISNATMETYQQGTTDNDFGQYSNCFQCHNKTTANPPTTPSVEISHIWTSLLPLFPQ